MINSRLLVIACGKSVTRLQNKTILRACKIRSQRVFFAPPILKLSLSHFMLFHIVLRIFLVLLVFLVHQTAKIRQDLSTFSSSLILREL